MKLGARLVVFAFSVCLCMGAHAHTLEGESGKHWKVISTADLQALVESKTDLTLVNVLPKIIHDKMHIPGSLNIPLGAVYGSHDLPENREALIVFYCMGRQCRYSPKAADIAHDDMGYNNLLVYRDGILAWLRAGLPVASLVSYPKVEVPLGSAVDLIKADDVWFLDLRPADHFARGHIKGSVNIDLEVLHEKVHLIPKDRRIVLVDHKGKLTLTTARFLASKGITDVVRLDGGINGWVKSALPLEKGSGSVVVVSPRTNAVDRPAP